MKSLNRNNRAAHPAPSNFRNKAMLIQNLVYKNNKYFFGIYKIRTQHHTSSLLPDDVQLLLGVSQSGLPAHDGVEPVLRVRGVLHNANGAIGLLQGVLPLDDVSSALLVLRLLVPAALPDVIVAAAVVEVVLGGFLEKKFLSGASQEALDLRTKSDSDSPCELGLL